MTIPRPTIHPQNTRTRHHFDEPTIVKTSNATAIRQDLCAQAPVEGRSASLLAQLLLRKPVGHDPLAWLSSVRRVVRPRGDIAEGQLFPLLRSLKRQVTVLRGASLLSYPKEDNRPEGDA